MASVVAPQAEARVIADTQSCRYVRSNPNAWWRPKYKVRHGHWLLLNDCGSGWKKWSAPRGYKKEPVAWWWGR